MHKRSNKLPLGVNMAEMEQGGGGVGEMINQLGQGLTMLVEGLGKAGAPPEIVEPFSAALEAFTAGAQALQSGGAPSQGAAAPEAGGAQAAPAGNMQMRG